LFRSDVTDDERKGDCRAPAEPNVDDDDDDGGGGGGSGAGVSIDVEETRSRQTGADLSTSSRRHHSHPGNPVCPSTVPASSPLLNPPPPTPALNFSPAAFDSRLADYVKACPQHVN